MRWWLHSSFLILNRLSEVFTHLRQSKFPSRRRTFYRGWWRWAFGDTNCWLLTSWSFSLLAFVHIKWTLKGWLIDSSLSYQLLFEQYFLLLFVYNVFHLLWLQVILENLVFKRKFIGNSTSHNLPEIWFLPIVFIDKAAGVPHLLQKVGHVFYQLIWILGKFRFSRLSY